MYFLTMFYRQVKPASSKRYGRTVLSVLVLTHGQLSMSKAEPLISDALINDWFTELAEARKIKTFYILSPSHWGLSLKT